MKKRITALTLSAMLFALCSPASAQQPGKIFRIGFLDPTNASDNAVRLEVFRQELRKLGWIEGKNIAFEYRFAEGRNDSLPKLATDLVRLTVDLIVVTTVGPALAAKTPPLPSPL